MQYDPPRRVDVGLLIDLCLGAQRQLAHDDDLEVIAQMASRRVLTRRGRAATGRVAGVALRHGGVADRDRDCDAGTSSRRCRPVSNYPRWVQGRLTQHLPVVTARRRSVRIPRHALGTWTATQGRNGAAAKPPFDGLRSCGRGHEGSHHECTETAAPRVRCALESVRT